MYNFLFWHSISKTAGLGFYKEQCVGSSGAPGLRIMASIVEWCIGLFLLLDYLASMEPRIYFMSRSNRLI